MDNKQKIKIYRNALVATVSLLLFYFVIVSLVSGFKFALSQLAFLSGFLLLFNQNPVSNQNIVQEWETKSDEQASVNVAITPLDISVDSKEWKFNVIMDTHSVELDQDLAELTVLIDGSGKEYKPLRWEGVPPGGHHREGVLIFSPITPAPESIELKVYGVDETTRSFTWNLK